MVAKKPKHVLRDTFFTGLAVLFPVVLTIYVVDLVLSIADRIFFLLPPAIRPPDAWRVPGAGLLVALLVILGAGVLARNYAGKAFVEYVNGVFERIPGVSGLYKTFRQISDLVLGNDAKAFKRVVLVQWPRPGVWMLGFVAAETGGILLRSVGESEPHLTIFVPTAPNPTSGFCCILPEKDVVPLAITVEQAFKTILSGGTIAPDEVVPIK